MAQMADVLIVQSLQHVWSQVTTRVWSQFTTRVWIQLFNRVKTILVMSRLRAS